MRTREEISKQIDHITTRSEKLLESESGEFVLHKTIAAQNIILLELLLDIRDLLDEPNPYLPA